MKRFVLALLLGLALLPLPRAHAAGPQTIYVSATGSVDGDGTITNPVQTLNDADSLVIDGSVVTVRIKPGTYTDQVDWSHDDTRFVPWDWQPGWTATNLANAGGYPTFDGGFKDDMGFTSEADRLTFHYVKFTRQIRVGMLLHNSEGHYLYGVVFTRIGTYYSKQSADQYAYGGLYPSEVTGMTVQNSTFKDILNNPGPSGQGYSHEHGVYFWKSHHNTIMSSLFQNVGGDPIRVRNESGYNTIKGNTFTSTGSSGYIGDYYATGEYKSWHNVFTGNTLKSKHPWSRGPFYPRFCYDIPGQCSQTRIKG